MKVLALTLIALTTLSTNAWETKNDTSYSGGYCSGLCISGSTELSGTSAVQMKEERKNKAIEQITAALAGEEVELDQEVASMVADHMNDGASFEDALIETLRTIISE